MPDPRLPHVGDRTLTVRACNTSHERGGEKNPKRDKAQLIDAALTTDGALLSLWDSLFTPNGLSAYFRDVAALEASASEIREYILCSFPGLLQTERYARSLIRVGRPRDSDDKIENAVLARLARQQILSREEPPSYALVLDEAVLRHLVGTLDTMVEQLDHLMELALLPNVSIQIIPFGTPGHPGLEGTFKLIKAPGRGEVVYTETRATGHPFDDQSVVDDYARVFGDLRGAALPDFPSREFIENIREEYAR